MFIGIIGWFWILTGVLFLIKPDMLKKRFQKKSNKVVRRYLFAMAIFLAMGLISVGLEVGGMIAKVLMVIVLIALIKGLFLLKSKIANNVIEFLRSKPASLFRIWAVAQIAIGALILMLR